MFWKRKNADDRPKKSGGMGANQRIAHLVELAMAENKDCIVLDDEMLFTWISTDVAIVYAKYGGKISENKPDEQGRIFVGAFNRMPVYWKPDGEQP